jgi:hypothetical protein
LIIVCFLVASCAPQRKPVFEEKPAASPKSGAVAVRGLDMSEDEAQEKAETFCRSYGMVAVPEEVPKGVSFICQ